MTTDVYPIIGNWYQRLDKDQEFEVVAFDEENGVVEIQLSDGKLEEIDIDSWNTLDLEGIENPDDYAGPLDDSDLGDLEYDESDMDDEEDWDES